MDHYRTPQLPARSQNPATPASATSVPMPLSIVRNMSLPPVPGMPLAGIHSAPMPMPITPLAPAPASAPIPPSLPCQPTTLVAEHPVVYGGAGQSAVERRPGVEYHHITVILPSDRQLFMVPGPLHHPATGSIALVQFPAQPAGHVSPIAPAIQQAPGYAVNPAPDQVFYARPETTTAATGQGAAADRPSDLAMVTVFSDPSLAAPRTAAATPMAALVAQTRNVDESAPLISAFMQPTALQEQHTSRVATAAARGGSARGRGRGRGRGARAAGPRAGSRKRSATTMDLALCRVSPPRKRATLPHDKSHMSGQLSTIPEPVNVQALLAANGMPTPAQQPRPAASARRRSKSDLAASDGLASGIGGRAGMPGHLMHQMAPGLHLQHSVDQILRSFQQGSSSFGAGAITASNQVSSTHGDLVPMFPRPSPQTVPSSVAPMALPNPPAIVGSSGTPMSLLLPTQLLPAPGFDISHLTSMLHAVSQPPPTGLPAECAGGHESHATDSVLVLKEMSPQSATRSGAGPSHPGDASLSADATTLARTLGTAAESIRTAAGDYGGILVDRVLRVVDGNIPDPIQEDKMPEAPTMR